MTGVKDIEYKIRKFQRGARVAAKTTKALEKEPAEAFLARNRMIIRDYTQKIIELKRLLFSMTGRHSPLCPRWPL